jgi:hypothetical protein
MMRVEGVIRQVDEDIAAACRLPANFFVRRSILTQAQWDRLYLGTWPGESTGDE